MSEEFEPKPDFFATKKFRMLVWGSMALVLCILALTHEDYKYTPVENAEPYEWTDGCPEGIYQKSRPNTKIPCECRKYEITDWLERGLPGYGPRGDTRYFRVGNDAIGITNRGWGRDNACYIDHIERNFFRVKVSEKGLDQ